MDSSAQAGLPQQCSEEDVAMDNREGNTTFIQVVLVNTHEHRSGEGTRPQAVWRVSNRGGSALLSEIKP